MGYTKSRRKGLELIGTGNNFLNRTPMAQALLRPIIDKWDLMKQQSFRKAEDRLIGPQQPTDWERILTNPTSDRGPI